MKTFYSKNNKIKKIKIIFSILNLILFFFITVIFLIFGFKYIKNNCKFSIEFAGGYQTQVQYEGKKNQKDVINLLKDRIDPLGTSNIYIEVINNSNNKYNLALSKDAGVDVSSFVHSILRKGYLYIIDSEGNDLLATEKINEKSTNWKKREKRILTSDIFSSIEAINNTITHRPELLFNIKNNSFLKEITYNKESKFYIYSDIGQLLDYIRSSMEGIRSLAVIIDNIKNDNNGKIKKSLTSLLDNNVPGIGNGSDILSRAKSQDPILIKLLNSNKNGHFGFNWVYSDNLNSNHNLSINTNDEKNTYDPNNRFDPTASPITGSPMNAWLPYIKDLLRLPYVSDILNEDVIDYRYIPYWIGEMKINNNNNILINSNDFNLKKVEQMKNILSAGLSKNDFTILSYSNINSTISLISLKIIIIFTLLIFSIISIIILFYYRILGIFFLITILLFLLFTIFSFVFVNGIIAPESIIALIISFALLIDIIINLLKSFKNEYAQTKNLINSFKIANKKTLHSSLDCSVIILIVNLVIFWFGNRSIKGFIIMTSISTFGIIIFGILLLRFVLWILLKNNLFENKPQILINDNQKNIIFLKNLLNIYKNQEKKEKNQNKFIIKLKLIKNQIKNNFNYKKILIYFNKFTKFSILGFIIIIITSSIFYIVAGTNFGSGFDKRTDFIGIGKIIQEPNDYNYNIIKEAEIAKNIINKKIIHKNEFTKYLKNVNWALIPGGEGITYQFKIIIQTTINSQIMQQSFNDFLNKITKDWKQESILKWGEINSVIAKSGIDLLLNMIFSISLSFVVILIYIIIRFQLTYIISFILSIIFSLLLTIAIINIFQIIISNSIIGILLGVMILTIIIVMSIFNNIREIKINNNQNKLINNQEIINIANKSIKNSLTKNLFITSIVLINLLIIMFIIPSFWIISLSLSIGCIVSLISSYFIAPFIWIYFEKWRIRKTKTRLNKIKNNFFDIDEHIIKGINE